MAFAIGVVVVLVLIFAVRTQQQANQLNRATVNLEPITPPPIGEVPPRRASPIVSGTPTATAFAPWSSQAVRAQPPAPTKPTTSTSNEKSPEFAATIARLVRDGHEFAAVKAYREQTGVSARNARQQVELLAAAWERSVKLKSS